MLRNQRSNWQHLLDHRKGKRVPEKHLLLLYWLRQSLWLCRSQQTGKFFKRWEYQTTWPASWEIWMQVKKQQLELDVEQWTGSKLGKEYVKAVYCYSYLTSMQTTLMTGYMKHRRGWEELPQVQCQEWHPRGVIPCPRLGAAAVRRYPACKVRNSSCALLEQPWRGTSRPR